MNGRRNNSGSLLTGLVEIFQNEEFGEKLQMSLPNMEKLLGWAVEAKNAFSQQFAAVLKTKRQRKRAQNHASIFAVSYHSLLHKAGTKTVRKTLRAFTEVHTYSGGDAPVAQ